MITKQQALTADTFHDNHNTNADGSCMRWRRNGKTRAWKTRDAEWVVPVKHGLYDYGAVTWLNAGSFHTADKCPR